MLVSGILPIVIAVVATIAASIAQDAYNELADVNSAIGFQDMPKSPGLREGLPPGR